MLIYDTCQDLFLLRSNPITRSNSKLPFAFVESPPHYWQICFCIMRSTCGCGASIRRRHSNGMPTMVRHERKGPKGPNVCNCLTDEGRPLGTGLQEQVSNHLRRLWSKAMVVSAEGKGPERTGSGD